VLGHTPIVHLSAFVPHSNEGDPAIGYIRELQPGRFMLQYTLAGKRKTKRLRDVTREQAESELERLESEASASRTRTPKKPAPRSPAPSKPRPAKPAPFKPPKPLLPDDEYVEAVLAAGGVTYRTRPEQPKALPLPCGSIIDAIELLNVERLLNSDGARELDRVIASGTLSFDDGDNDRLAIEIAMELLGI
jgi:hypothetical protein